MEKVQQRSIYNSNVCVVGGCGFLGSHLVKLLVEDYKCNVLVIDNLSSGKLKFLEGIDNVNLFSCYLTMIEMDVVTCSFNYLKDTFLRFEIEYIFNYAADPYIPDCYDSPIKTFANTAVGALNVIEAGNAADVKGILQVSSAELYGSFDSINAKDGIDEKAKIEPHSTYGAAKAAVDYLVQCRWKESNVPVMALRQFNCVGENETHPYVIPEIIKQIVHNGIQQKDGHPVKYIQLGNNTHRDFMYVKDAVKIAVDLMEYGSFGEVYNSGSERTIPIYTLAEIIDEIYRQIIKDKKESTRLASINPNFLKDSIDYKLVVTFDEKRKRKWDILYLKSNNKKLMNTIPTKQITINTSPIVETKQVLEMTSLETAIAKTIQYYFDNDCKWCWEE